MNLNDAQRKAFYALLSEATDRSPKRAEDMARAILMADLDHLTAEIRAELVNIQAGQERDRDEWQRHYYVFLAPLPADSIKPKLVNSTKDIDWYEKPQRHGVKVQLRHLAAFCKENRLKEKEMIAVGEGEQYEHRGWTRKPGLGPTMMLGKEWREPAPEVALSLPAGGKKENRYVFKFALPDQTWTPD